jgi:glycosyltransferase involved in cell wall biosynthesis
MKILIVNNFYYNRGGDCTYMFSLKKQLESKGHKVCIYSMHHPKNIDSGYSKYFVSYINYDEEVRRNNLSSGIKVIKRTIYSREAKNKIEALIKAEKPDIAHIQNIHHHITPSIFFVFKKYNIPIVWTLHDYTVICPNTSFLAKGKVCEKCKKHKYYWPSLVKCKKNSFGASTMAALETSIHRIIKISDMVDVFIAPSKFLQDKFIEYGVTRDKIVQISLFTDIELHNKIKTTDDYYLFVGRITEEKGIKTLIDAAVKVNSSKLKIAGDGPLLEKMMDYANSEDKNGIVEFLGYKSHAELTKLYMNCRFIVVPSEWYETSGLVIFEAFAFGKPAIGSKMGGIPELITDTERGLIFEPGDSEDLSKTIKYLLNNPDLVEEMGNNALKFVQEFNSEKHYKELIEIYNKVVS